MGFFVRSNGIPLLFLLLLRIRIRKGLVAWYAIQAAVMAVIVHLSRMVNLTSGTDPSPLLDPPEVGSLGLLQQATCRCSRCSRCSRGPRGPRWWRPWWWMLEGERCQGWWVARRKSVVQSVEGHRMADPFPSLGREKMGFNRGGCCLPPVPCSTRRTLPARSKPNFAALSAVGPSSSRSVIPVSARRL